MRLDAKRLVPLGALAALGVAYAALRPTLMGVVWHLEILEVPAAILVAAPLVWLTVRPEPSPPHRPSDEWRRHEQVVRLLPDPEAAPLARELAERAALAAGGSRKKRDAYLQRIIDEEEPGA